MTGAVELTAPLQAPRTSRAGAATVVVAGLALAGALAGALWVWLTPSVRGVVALSKSGNRVHAFLGREADHFFVAAFLMLGLLTVVAVVAAVWAWQWRAHRGPLMVIALSVGAVLGGALATTVGALLGRWRYGVLDMAAAPVSPDHRVYYFTQAPSVFFGHGVLQMVATLVVPAATAALVYALLAVSTARDDLGAYPAVELPSLPPLLPPMLPPMPPMPHPGTPQESPSFGEPPR